MSTVEEFRRIAESWTPEVLLDADRIAWQPAARFAAMLDEPPPCRGHGDPLPPLWHWFQFLPVYSQADLGDDGHPRSGPLVPPIVGRRRMFAGGRVRWHAPVYVGEVVNRRAEVVSREVKEGKRGVMLFVTTRYTMSVGSETRVIEEQDIVYLLPDRDVEYIQGPTLGREGIPEGHRGSWRVAIDTDPILLFRFSALTANCHRIHYDVPYTREEEGHPDLLIHGPLTALLLLELPRRHSPGRAVNRFDWRARAPLYVGERVHASGQCQDGDWQLAAGSVRVPEAVVGRVETSPSEQTQP